MKNHSSILVRRVSLILPPNNDPEKKEFQNTDTPEPLSHCRMEAGQKSNRQNQAQQLKQLSMRRGRWRRNKQVDEEKRASITGKKARGRC